MNQAAKLGTAVVLLCLWAVAPCAAGGLKIFTRTFGPFTKDPYYKIFAVKEPASINNDALQITPDSANQGFKFNDQSGRVMYKKRFKLWVGPNGSESARVGSFNTSFIVNLSPVNNNSVTGEGMAFVIAPDLDLTPGSDGQYLGLTNLTTDGNDTNHLVAVELDTFKQEFDPDSNHIGLNINSVRSNANVSLTPLGIKLMSNGTEAFFYNIWVQYDGNNKSIEVYIAEATQEGPYPPRPEKSVLSSHLDLSRVVNQYSYFGFSASTSNATQLNCVLRWNLTVEYFSEKKFPLVKVSVAAGLPTLAVVAAAVVLGFILRKRRIIMSNSSILGALKNLPGTPREFVFKDLKKATNKFDERNKLGQGGESIKGQDDFLAELTIINRLRHKHLVRLLGWCYKNGKLLLVYDYMPNGSLDKHLFQEADSKLLIWTLRYKIISWFGRCPPLPPQRVRSEGGFGDFGLARALDNEKTSYAEAEGVPGTMGYIAPECFHMGKATQQSDVYAFGAVLLEVVCGLRPGTQIGRFQFLVDWVWALHREGQLLEAVDDRLGEDYVVEEAQRVLLLGLACSHPMASERPKTQTIVQVLSGSVPGPNVAPFKPAFIWPSMPMGEEDISQVTTTDTKPFPTSHFGSPWTSQ
ncbi:concanavalin A-like lectin protein kinase family protein [Actinidia rufa]|uniref:non-specific serine/threonine protein kinase n=1 Tax=Actinidia rufa TaxID=165716 RepID=A0A7J0EQ09_9ERIC|nr:concanavalin A-like lectin protein kinase family protein [Actinidia rufa]